jgi:hypothetical protein
MTFLTDLERLKGAATDGPWIADNNEGFSQWKIWENCSPSGYGAAGKRIADVIGDSAETDANAELIAFLINHADALAELVRAAEIMSRALDTGHRNNDGTQMGVRNPEKHHVDALRNALAKLNGAEK